MAELSSIKMQILHPHALRVGDEVIVVNDSRCAFRRNNRGYIERCLASSAWGLPAVLAGFAMKYKGRWERKPGFYYDLYCPFIKVKNVQSLSFDMRDGFYLRPMDLMPTDRPEYLRRLQELSKTGEHPEDSFVCDTPDTPFWEGDWVRVRDGVFLGDRGLPLPDPTRENAYMISSLDFTLSSLKYDEKINHPLRYHFREVSFHDFQTPEISPSYHIGDCFRRGPAYPLWHPEELELVERGNIWRQAHGQDLCFTSLEEEVFFHCIIGNISYVTPSAEYKKQLFYQSSEDGWKNQDAARTAVLEGHGHGIRYRFEWYDWSGDEWWEVISFRDEDLGQRVREATKEGFVIPTHEWIDEQERKNKSIAK